MRLNCCRFAWFCAPLWDFTKPLNLWKFGTFLVAGSLSRQCRATPSDWAFHQAMNVGFSGHPGSSRAPLRVWYPKLHYKQANFYKMELFPFLQIPWNPFSNNFVFLEFKFKLWQNSFLTEELLPWFGFAGCYSPGCYTAHPLPVPRGWPLPRALPAF